jgi:phosphatidylglycerol:prolipoprotein diacylglycerol transferase
MVVAGVIGARLFYVALNWQIYMQDPLEILMIQHGGLAWQGSFIVGGLSGYLFLRKHNLPVRPMLDLAAPYVALGQVFGRMGCFLNGCCYGRPVSWGVQFPFDDNPLHPTQLYASGALFLIFLFLMWRKQQPHYAGQIFVWYLVLMAFQRGVIQFARYDYEPWFAGLGVFQWVAVGIMGLGFVLHWRWHRDSKG